MGRIGHYVGVDYAENSILEAVDRYNRMKERGNTFPAKFIVADCHKVSVHTCLLVCLFVCLGVLII